MFGGSGCGLVPVASSGDGPYDGSHRCGPAAGPVLSRSATPLLQDEARDRLRRVVRHLRHHGDVGVGGEDDAGVPELVLDDLQIGTCLQREAAGAVPQIMQPDRRQSAGLDERVEGAGERVRADRLAVLAGEHISAAIGVERGEFSALALAVSAQRLHRSAVQRDGASSCLGLGWSGNEGAADPLSLAVDRGDAPVPAHLRDVDPNEIERPRWALLVQAYRQLDRLTAMDFVPVISPGTANDEARYTEWTDAGRQENRIEAFKRRFPDEIGVGDHPIAFLIVKSMLLTGFDAPIEQVLYVDRSLKQAELLQAVARVNRTAERKTCGYVIDYYGVANHLQEALKAYAAEDVEGALKDLKDEIAKLDQRRRRVRMLFTDRGVVPASAEQAKEQCVHLLADPQLFDRFEVELRKFLATVDKVLPRPDVKPFIPDSRLFAEIQLRARRRYRIDDGDFDPSLYGEKVRELIDQHLESLGIEQLLPPVSLTADDFREKVARLPGARAKASEMEHAIRHHIEVSFAKDPRRYRLLSERLAEILQQHQDEWEQQIHALGDLLVDLERDRPAEDDPLSPVERALYGVLLEETATDGVVDEATDRRLVDFSTKIQNVAVETISPPRLLAPDRRPAGLLLAHRATPHRGRPLRPSAGHGHRGQALRGDPTQPRQRSPSLIGMSIPSAGPRRLAGLGLWASTVLTTCRWVTWTFMSGSVSSVAPCA
jgi:hypothetical protein